MTDARWQTEVQLWIYAQTTVDLPCRKPIEGFNNYDDCEEEDCDDDHDHNYGSQLKSRVKIMMIMRGRIMIAVFRLKLPASDVIAASKFSC